MKKPIIQIENGRTVVAMELQVDSRRRPDEAAKPPRTRTAVPVKHAAGAAEDDDEQDQDEPAPGKDPDGDPEEGSPIDEYCWRFISAAQLWPSTFWGPQCVDYTHDNAKAIKQAIPLIRNCRPPVMLNHTNDMNSQVGVMGNAEWENSKDIPPGVSGTLLASDDFDRKTAFGLRNEFISAGSISLNCKMEMSHPDMDMDKFLDDQGMNIDGEVVRWLPIETVAVQHFALVGAGADPDARPRALDGTRTEHGGNPNGCGKENGDMNILELLESICRQLGVEVSLAAGQPLPPTLASRLEAQINKLTIGHTRFNELAAGVHAMAPFVAAEGESIPDTAEIMKLLPPRLELAKHGEAYLEALRTEAVKWYGLATFEKANKAPSDREKRRIDAMRMCCSVQELLDLIEEYRPVGAGNLGPMRSSEGSELPPEPGTPKVGKDQISAGVDKTFRRGKDKK